MASTIYINFNGYDIALNIGHAFSGNGVVIDPETHDLAAPGFMAAIIAAVAIYPNIYAAFWLQEFALINGEIEDFDYVKKLLRREEIEQLEDVIKYCELAQLQSHIDISVGTIQYGELAKQELQRRAEAEAKKENRKRPGYIYLLQSPSGSYKIGRTQTPEDRLKTFRLTLPFEVEYVCLVQTNDMSSLEKQLHKQFKPKHINGEWFNLSPEDVEYIKGLTS